MALAVSTAMGELKVNSVSLHTPAWKIKQVVWLWFDSPLRGSYTTTPGKDGEDPVPMRNTSAQWDMDFVMVGDVDHTGEKYAAADGYEARAIGLASNMNYLRTHVLTGRTLTGNRTRSATLQVPGEEELRTADVHCWLTPGPTTNRFVFEGTFHLRIPDGVFA